MLDTAVETKKAICSHCSARCGVLVQVEGDRPVGIAGDLQHPVSKGFLCRRGLAAIEYFEHPERLLYPLKRVGARGEGRWEQVGWDEAMDDIAARLGRIRDLSGPEAVAYLCGTYHGPDQGIGIRFLNLFGSPNYGGTSFICNGPRTAAESLVFGFALSSPDARPGETRCVLLWGQHPSASNPKAWGWLRQVQKAGAKLIVIDPVRTAEADAADLWLQPRPGADAALALALLHVVIEEGLYDRAFVERWSLGFEALRRRASEYPPERAAEITWIPPQQIRECARLFASQRPSVLIRGSNNGMGRNAQSCERAVAALTAIMGDLDRPGGTRLQGPPGRFRTRLDLDEIDALPPERRAKRLGSDRFRLHGEGYERIVEAQRRLWPEHRWLVGANTLGAAHAPSIFRAILTGEPYPVRAVLVQHNNPIGAFPNAKLVRDALSSDNLDLLVVQELFMTATAKLADYVLPAAHWLEKPHLYVPQVGSTVFAAPRAVAPRGERRDNYAVWRDLGRRLGQGAHWPETLEASWDEQLAPEGLTFEELSTRERSWVSVPEPPLRHEWPDPATGEPLGFGTPSGRVELAPSILADLGYDPLPRYEELLPELADAETYPLVLMTGQTDILRTHQDHRQVASLRRDHPDPLMRIAPDTAAELGIAEGDWVWIVSPLGRVRQRATLTDRVHPRVVDAERWWYPERSGGETELFGALESGVNTLTEDDPSLCDPTHGSWPFRIGRCRVVVADDGR